MFDLPEGKRSQHLQKVKLILGALESILKEDDANGFAQEEKALFRRSKVSHLPKM